MHKAVLKGIRIKKPYPAAKAEHIKIFGGIKNYGHYEKQTDRYRPRPHRSRHYHAVRPFHGPHRPEQDHHRL